MQGSELHFTSKGVGMGCGMMLGRGSKLRCRSYPGVMEVRARGPPRGEGAGRGNGSQPCRLQGQQGLVLSGCGGE